MRRGLLLLLVPLLAGCVTSSQVRATCERAGWESAECAYEQATLARQRRAALVGSDQLGDIQRDATRPAYIPVRRP